MRAHRGESLMVVGGAGVGKSFLLRIIADTVPSLVTATTGTAAALIDGKTTYAALCDDPDMATTAPYYEWLKKRSRMAGRAIYGKHAMIIEEASMLSVAQIERIDRQLRDLGNRVEAGRNQRPFGGYQMFFFLDPTQLPPVNGGDQLVFEAPAIAALAPHVAILRRMFRQTTPLLIHLVECARYCVPTPLAVLTAATLERIAEGMRGRANGIVATTLRERAEGVNAERIRAYDRPVEIPVRWDNGITGVGRFRVDGRELVVTNVIREQSSPAPARNPVAVGAPVRIRRNIAALRVTNGMLGVLREINAEGTEARVVVGDGHRRRVVKLGVHSTYSLCCKVAGVGEPITVTGHGVPIQAAYGSTIHALQGNTVLSPMFLDLRAGRMEPGLLYTGVSRVVSLRNLLPDGLVVALDKCRMHPSAVRFLAENGFDCATRRTELRAESDALLPRFADMFRDETGIEVVSLRFILRGLERDARDAVRTAFDTWCAAGLAPLLVAQP